jgi:chloramphenicol 3-O-phosphotransferase
MEAALPHLVIIYGPPLSGKSSVAQALARSLSQKAALVSIDALLTESILIPDRDAVSELEMVHTQARLMVANYLKNGYHVVVEGAFYYERDGVLHRHEQEIDQLVSLMRNLARSPLVVRLSAEDAALSRRAETSNRQGELAPAMRIEAEYKPRYGNRILRIETDEASVAEIAEQIKERTEAEFA